MEEKAVEGGKIIYYGARGAGARGMKSPPQPPNACGLCSCFGFREKEEQGQSPLTIPKGYDSEGEFRSR